MFKVMEKKTLAIMVVIGLLFMGTLFFFSGSISRARAESSIGYVSILAIFDAHPEKDQLSFEFQQRADEMRAELEEEAQDLDPDEQERLVESYEQQLAQYEQELIAGLIDEIDDVVARVAERENVQVVLEAQNVIYGGLDLTELVLEEIQKEYAEE